MPRYSRKKNIYIYKIQKMINYKKLDIEKRQHSVPAKLTKRTKK